MFQGYLYLLYIYKYAVVATQHQTAILYIVDVLSSGFFIQWCHNDSIKLAMAKVVKS